jgi:hypothetical protein
MDFYAGRKKKSDKAKEKVGRPSQKHVREYEKKIENIRIKNGLQTKKNL